MHHLDATFRWASDPNIRQHSFTQKAISRDEHNEWFHRKLKDPNCIYLIGLQSDEPFGSVRFDLTDSEAVISFLVDPRWQGKGLGYYLIRKGIEHVELRWHYKKGLVVAGYVMVNNIPSARTFDKLEFMHQFQADRIRYYKILLNE
jgi:UDP-2,4-diacetamido-2,4,6-trideoxy-beta-L-altropyranose hydrolase